MASNTPKSNYFNFKNGNIYYTLDLSKITGYAVSGSGSHSNCDYQGVTNTTSIATNFKTNNSMIYASNGNYPKIIGLNILNCGDTDSYGHEYAGDIGITSIVFDKTISSTAGTLYMDLTYKESITSEGNWSSKVIAKFNSISNFDDGNGSLKTESKPRLNSGNYTYNISSLTIDGKDYTQVTGEGSKGNCYDVFYSSCCANRPSTKKYINDSSYSSFSGYHEWIIKAYVKWDDGFISDSVSVCVKVLSGTSDNIYVNGTLIGTGTSEYTYTGGMTRLSCYVPLS